MRETINAERDLIDAIKTANAYDMDNPIGPESKTIAKKVRASQGIVEGAVADLSVSVRKVQDGKGKEVGEIVFVQTATPAPDNPNQTNFNYTPVASVFEGVVLPEDGFVREEAIAVSGMVEGLKEAKRRGALRHLSPDLTSIQDPTTMLMILPTVK